MNTENKKPKKPSSLHKKYMERIGKLFWKGRTDYDKYDEKTGTYSKTYSLVMVVDLKRPYGTCPYEYVMQELCNPDDYFYHNGTFGIKASRFKYPPIDPQDPTAMPGSENYYKNSGSDK